MTDTGWLPEDIEYAGFWTRFSTTLLDTLILLLITLPLTFACYGSAIWKNNGHVSLGSWDVVISWVFPAIAVDKNKQGWLDKIAKTVVIKNKTVKPVDMA